MMVDFIYFFTIKQGAAPVLFLGSHPATCLQPVLKTICISARAFGHGAGFRASCGPFRPVPGHWWRRSAASPLSAGSGEIKFSPVPHPRPVSRPAALCRGAKLFSRVLKCSGRFYAASPCALTMAPQRFRAPSRYCRRNDHVTYSAAVRLPAKRKGTR